MIAIRGGDVVLPSRIAAGATVLVEEDHIAAIETSGEVPEGVTVVDASGCHVVPGFIDVHVHGVAGHDTLDAGSPVDGMRRALVRFGVTAFCPTTVACAPDALTAFLDQVAARRGSGRDGARVLPAHLESNFINPEYAGAQPLECLRLPPRDRGTARRGPKARPPSREAEGFSSDDVLAVIAAHRADVGIVTLAPELTGGIELVRTLVAAGHCVSIGHTGADYDTALAAVKAGARHATHLFNRMTPLSHRAPGVVGAVFESEAVAVELIADGVHVHPAMCRFAIGIKGASGVMAISDGTAVAGLPIGQTASLGRRRIHARSHAAVLDDGTMAGSVATMNRIFATLVSDCGASLVDAATMCATTPARQLGLARHGVIEAGAVADIAVLDADFEVRHTLVDGRVVYSAAP
jgi:N-acetylglucosamine-6-phosphate deacetylase